MKKLIKILKLVVLIITVAMCVLYFAMYDTRFTVPELAEIPTSNFEEGEKIFHDRVEKKFAIGTPIAEVVAELEKQGFKVSQDRGYARYEKQSFPCTLVWQIVWKGNIEKITHINATFSGVCL